MKPTEPGEPRLVVSLDGPASSGKSSVGAAAAARLGYRFFDTGLLYRGLTWLALLRGVAPDAERELVALVEQIVIEDDGRGNLAGVSVGGRDVTEEVRSAEVDAVVSHVARHPGVRSALLDVQRQLAAGGGIIVAGRDIGTVVLPDAHVKLYLDASLPERARRRALESGAGHDEAALLDIEDELRRRDGVDSTRSAAPLRVPEGARVIVTDGITLDETVQIVARAVADAADAARRAPTASTAPTAPTPPSAGVGGAEMRE